MRSLRARLFAATLAALAADARLTIAIGAVLTRRQVDKSQATSLARRADDLHAAASAAARATSTRTSSRATCASSSTAARTTARGSCRNVARASDGKTTYEGKRYLYSYRPLPPRGLLAAPVGEPRAPPRGGPFLRDLLLAGARRRRVRGGALVLRRPLDRRGRSGASPTRAARSPPRSARRRCPRRARPSSRRSREAFNEMAAELAASRDAERALPALRQPRAEDAADGDPRLRRGPGRRRVRRRRGGPHDRARGAPARAARPRPARPRADEPQRVLDRAASRSTSRRSRARRSRGTRPRRATSRSRSAPRASRRGSRPTTTGCSRSPRTSSRTRCARRRAAAR